MADTKKRSNCPISCALEIWGDKWSLLIVRDLLFFKERTYSDFLKSEEKIATNILATRLQMLEENGIITKLDHPESKAKVLYRLSPKGVDLLPLIIEINVWADKYLTIPAEQKALLKEIRKNKEAYIKKRIKELKIEYSADRS
ncbi:winged helix-turn-helix transcriptional regulator [Bacteroides reticulotermitis]|uniref:DNA-binding HxlR family transcriptional regulator n=1 Tax=Bacteroides reticulotermitis TaxID=1133319 RepID=A0A840CUD4_9BACE|nr:helix-turn-helix domain-containing protein [Bacteroides reticulotermitis]MBB4043500.1 DNA-binding HxlR family transcriptional regulator [Bacteroides reticulotermitis]HJD77110.1 helix-turn-helix transcriptional regulator [Bacteroides reticulotermitis]